MQYCIVEGKDYRALQFRVNQKIADGWVPQGAMSVATLPVPGIGGGLGLFQKPEFKYSQAMVKDGPPPPPLASPRPLPRAMPVARDEDEEIPVADFVHD